MTLERLGRPFLAAALLAPLATGVTAQCPPEAPLKNYTGGGTTACPCFVSGEEAGVVLTAPANHYPIEITKIRIAWGSVFGGAPQSLESALKIYPAGLPNPGVAQFSVAGPTLTDGFINEFDVSAIPGNKIISSGPFTVTLEFLNSNSGNVFAPSVVHDGNGCQAGKNVVKAIPGGWSDACALGVTGDWVMEVVYERAAAATVNNGTGANPLTLTNVSTPSLGATWTVDLDCTGHAASIASMLGYTGILGTPATFSFGELIIDPGSILILKQNKAHGGGVATYNNVVPNDVSLCGLTMYVQGACFGAPGVQLSNALAVRVGD